MGITPTTESLLALTMSCGKWIITAWTGTRRNAKSRNGTLPTAVVWNAKLEGESRINGPDQGARLLETHFPGPEVSMVEGCLCATHVPVYRSGMTWRLFSSHASLHITPQSHDLLDCMFYFHRYRLCAAHAALSSSL